MCCTSANVCFFTGDEGAEASWDSCRFSIFPAVCQGQAAKVVAAFAFIRRHVLWNRKSFARRIRAFTENLEHGLSSLRARPERKENSLFRCFFPKERSLNGVSPDTVQRVQNWINRFPRKAFRFASPCEISQTILFILQFRFIFSPRHFCSFLPSLHTWNQGKERLSREPAK